MTIPAIYGFTKYGTTVYGATFTADWVIEPFTATAINYTSIALSWHQPKSAAQEWRLVRNRYGYPVDEQDGTILFDVTEYPGNFFLDNEIIPGQFHYYGVYAYSAIDGEWHRAGVTACLAVKSFNTAEWMFSNLPAYFTEYLNGELTQDAAGNPYLLQFLAVLAWGIDYVKTCYEMSARHINDPIAIPLGDMINLAAEIGLDWDPMISAYLMRKATANWTHLNAERGTLGGIETHLSLMTGFGVDLQVGKNLMLEQDQSEFTDPVYPPYDPSIDYVSGERVGYGNYWYSCALTGTKGIAPTGTGSSNSNWTVILDSDEATGLLTSPLTSWPNTWEVIYPGVTNGAPLAGSLVEGIGVVNPLNASQFNFNDLRVYNKGGSSQDIIARSVSRTTADMGTTRADWHPDPAQPISDGIPVPFTRPSQAWDSDTRYGTNDIVTYDGLPFMARRASTGATPPSNLTATAEWYPLSPNARLPLMVSAYTSTKFTGSPTQAAVTPFVEWYDEWGNFIARVYARTPTPGTPGIPDQLAFDSFTKAPGGISGRTFDNGYAHNWSAQDGNFTVSGYGGGVVYPTTTGTRSMALTTGPANGQVGVTFVTAATGGQAQAIVFRFSDENNYWKATTNALIKKVAGSFTTVATYSTAAQNGDRLVVQMNAGAITVLLNGSSVATASDTFNDTATEHGMLVE